MQLWPLKTTESANRKIFRAALIVGMLTLVTKTGSTVKELIVARTFGRNDALDAFLIAFLLPGFALGLVMGVFSSTLIPALVEAR
jgi:putative peptidoglycan lipid II flippase